MVFFSTNYVTGCKNFFLVKQNSVLCGTVASSGPRVHPPAHFIKMNTQQWWIIIWRDKTETLAKKKRAVPLLLSTVNSIWTARKFIRPSEVVDWTWSTVKVTNGTKFHELSSSSLYANGTTRCKVYSYSSSYPVNTKLKLRAGDCLNRLGLLTRAFIPSS
jgi:hypothetical protein